jgi:hypothetical protein
METTRRAVIAAGGARSRQFRTQQHQRASMADRTDASESPWRGSAPSRRKSQQESRQGRIIAVGVVVCVLIGAVIAWLLLLAPSVEPHFLPIYVSEHGDALPPRAWVRQDAEALGTLHWRARDTFPSQKRDLMRGELRNLATLHDAPVILYVNGYLRSDRKHGPCLLPVDAALHHPDSWLPLSEVFESLRACRARHKLVLLDVMQPCSDLAQGLLGEDTASLVAPLLDEAADGDHHLTILCACSAGQTSLTAEELGHSVFAYFLCQGLSGQADGHNARKRKDGRVSLRELEDYLILEVDRWAQSHRGVRQTPRRFGAEDDFEIVQVRDGAAAIISPLEETYPAWLADGWKLRDEWWQKDVFRHAPASLRRLEDTLLRGEQQWRAGVESEGIQRDLQGRLRRLRRQGEETTAPAAGPPSSLARAIAGLPPGKSPAERSTLVDLERLAARQGKARVGKPTEAELQKLQADTEAFRKPFEGKPLELSWLVFEAAIDDQTPPEALPFLAGILPTPPAPRYAETQFLERLATKMGDRGTEWPAPVARDALRMVQAAERAALTEAGIHPWVAAVEKEAARLRLDAEEILLGTDAAGRPRCGELLRGARAHYERIAQEGAVIAAATRLRDETLIRLPTFLGYLDAVDAAEWDEAWDKAATTAERLRDVLREPSADPEKRNQQIELMSQYRETLQDDPKGMLKLRALMEPPGFQRLIEQSSTGNLADALQATALLETPWLNASQRVSLWKARMQGLAAMEKSRPAAVAPAWDEVRAGEQQRSRLLRRVKRSLRVLQLHDVANLERLSKALAEATAKRDDPAVLRTVATELRQAWDREPGRKP